MMLNIQYYQNILSNTLGIIFNWVWSIHLAEQDSYDLIEVFVFYKNIVISFLGMIR